MTVGGVSAAVSKTAAAPIERVKLLIQNQVSSENRSSTTNPTFPAPPNLASPVLSFFGFEFFYESSHRTASTKNHEVPKSAL